MNIVLLHGWGFESKIWDPFLSHLDDSFNVIPLDLPGFGNAKLPSNTLSLDLMTQQILENSPDSSVFIGWSLGGLIAMNIAIQHPDRISHLITFASTPKFVATNEWPGMSAQLLDQFYESLNLDHQATLQQFALLQFHGTKTDRSIIKSVRELVANNKTPNERALKESLDILKETDLRNELQKITCPQFYFFGRCDTLVPAEASEKIKSLTKNREVELLQKMSHAPFLTDPKLCADKIKGFLE